MRIVFAGTPEFSARALDTILAQGHQVLAVLTQPDRPAGRRMRHLPSAVKQRALAAGLPVFQPETLRDAGTQAELAAWFTEQQADVMVVAAYGLLLPPAVLGMPRLGCLNIHASLLPRWRGAAPIARAILAGDTNTGICIMQMDAGLDTGPVLQTRSADILPRDTAGSLLDRLATIGAAAIVEVLAMLERRENPTPVAQAATGVTYAGKISKAEAVLNFELGAIELDRRVRAFDPAPGSVAILRGTALKIWGVRPGPRGARVLPPGTVRGVEGGSFGLACGHDGRDTLIVEELQKPGGKRLAVAQFLLGFPLSAGERFGSTGESS
jgi:methionyl-tRNA formyltransferase